MGGLVAERGRPGFLRVDNAPEFVARVVASWAAEVGVTCWFTDPGSPRQGGICGSLTAQLREEVLDGQLVESIREARALLEHDGHCTNATRVHGSLGYLSPAELRNLDVAIQWTILAALARSRKRYALEIIGARSDQRAGT